MKKIQDSVIIICGIVRDAERGLIANVPVIKALCNKCHDYRVVVFENDSKDRTKTLLKEWSDVDPERIHCICTDTDGKKTIPSQKTVKTNRFFCHARIDKMNRLRNQYLDYVEQQGWKGDYLMVVDLDVAKLNTDGILSSFETNIVWDAITAFGYSLSPRLKRRYHDTYALTKWGEQTIPQTEAMIIRYADELGGLKTSDDLIRVYSAFGGLAVYRFEAVQGLRYSVVENNDPQVEVHSEHVGLYKQMVERGFDKFYINPAMRILYQRVTFKIAWESLKRKVCKLLDSAL